MIRTENLHKSFHIAGRENLHVLRGVNEHIKKGEVVSVIGPSGGGKSTFLRCLNMLETPEEGKIFFEGVEITGANVDINIHRQKMGMVYSTSMFSPISPSRIISPWLPFFSRRRPSRKRMKWPRNCSIVLV